MKEHIDQGGTPRLYGHNRSHTSTTYWGGSIPTVPWTVLGGVEFELFFGSSCYRGRAELWLAWPVHFYFLFFSYLDLIWLGCIFSPFWPNRGCQLQIFFSSLPRSGNWLDLDIDDININMDFFLFRFGLGSLFNLHTIGSIYLIRIRRDPGYLKNVSEP
jgi:hypothetical protein